MENVRVLQNNYRPDRTFVKGGPMSNNLPLSSQVGSARDLRPDGRWFRDSAGRYVMFRGVNFASRSKLPPDYLPFLPGDDAPKLLKLLKQLGIKEAAARQFPL